MENFVMPDDVPKVQLFTHLYLTRTTPIADSPTFRRRVGSYLDEVTDDDNVSIQLGKFLTREIGIKIPQRGYPYYYEKFFTEVDIKYLLNSITLVWRFLFNIHKSKYISPTEPDPAKNWRKFVQRTFDEENVSYTLDEFCGVHFRVDQEFEHNRIALLSVLNGQRYAGVRAAFEDAHRHLDSQPPDTKAAVRSMFESVEILVKLIVDTKNLNKWIVENSLKSIALDIYSGDDVAKNAVSKALDGIAQWVDGLHYYRHGQGIPEPVAPPLDFTVYVMSSGAAFLRWLTEIHMKIPTPKTAAD
jgi:hypothetical protein